MPLIAQSADPAQAKLLIHTDQASKEVQEPGEDESYSLAVTPSGARLSAPNPLGTLHGLQTFLQLVEAGPAGFAVPVLSIHDTPRFVWRGLMIDVSRHFIPLDVIKRNLDGMEAVKMNVFHWHLSDGQGFRVESKKFPSFRKWAPTAYTIRKPKCATSSPTRTIAASAWFPNSTCRATAQPGSSGIPN